MTIQLVRAWPPGYGGVERVAHELSMLRGWKIYSFGINNTAQRKERDPLNVTYQRIKLAALNIGKLTLPLPSNTMMDMLRSRETLIAHLPCPASLLVCLLARLIQPRRKIIIYWHAFLNSGTKLSRITSSIYENLAIRFATSCEQVITTSPALKDELQQRGCWQQNVLLLPCCINESLENAALRIDSKTTQYETRLRVLYIGRLDSYKRVDWLIQAADNAQQELLHQGSIASLTVDVVGDGPQRSFLEKTATKACIPVHFWGRATEAEKLKRIGHADVLVLPSQSCNEAFGIVQLEAMAAGVPALAFKVKASGMDWVCKLEKLMWSHDRAGLPIVLMTLAKDRDLCRVLGKQARKRYQNLFGRKVWATTTLEINAEMTGDE